MLVRPLGDGSALCIGQASHAWVSGQFARAWAEPQPEAVVLAAEQHDVGMALWDLRPLRDPATGLPYDFRAMPRAVHVTLWDAAAEHLLSQSAHAALLVSLHGTGLYERFPAPEADAPLVEPFLARQRALQARLAGALGLDPGVLREQQALLARWDALSLELCLRQDPSEPHVLDPWPFAPPSLEVVAEARRLRGPCPGDAALRAALADARPEPLRFRLVSG
jgi:hypothetical protein